jgi:glucokinase
MKTAGAFAIGVDLGGTRLKVARVDRSGALRDFAARPSRLEESAQAPLEAIVDEVRARLEGGVVGVGVGCPGVIGADGRLVDRTAHLPHWRDFDLRGELERRLDLPIAVDNDANLAALAEHRFGAARGARVSITVTLGTGIGCGIVIDGRIHRGAWGGAGELGHVPLGSGGEACACGVPNCVEPEASGSGLAREAQRAGFEPADAATVLTRAAAGDGTAQALVERFADRLSATLATAVHILNPEVVVIGGGLIGAGDLLLDRVREGIQRYTLASHRRGLRVVAAALGERAGVAGAGGLAWEKFAGSEAPAATLPGDGA